MTTTINKVSWTPIKGSHVVISNELTITDSEHRVIKVPFTVDLTKVTDEAGRPVNLNMEQFDLIFNYLEQKEQTNA